MTAKLINNNTESLADFLSQGEVVRSRWMVFERIGSGGFGQVFSAHDHDSGSAVAIKAESNDCLYPQLCKEMIFLREVQASNGQNGHPYIPRFYHYGSWNNVSYMVTELCGPNLRTLKKSTANDVFSSFSSFWIMKQMVKAVRAVHQFGYLHRDVKPSNFVIGHSSNYGRRFFIIDFGLVKRIRRRHQNSRNRKFKGTLRYASLAAQRYEEPRLTDDMWSIFYITVENICSQLPWRCLSSKAAVDSSKASCHNSRFANIRYPNNYSAVPRVLRHFFDYLSSGDFENEKNYAKLTDLVEEEFERLGLNERTSSLDWETPLSEAAQENEKCRLRCDERVAIAA